MRHTFPLYDPPKHLPLYLTEDMLAHKLADFPPTPTFKPHLPHHNKTTT
ncbi:hypothetical protein [Staphylococcus aureus]